MNFIEAIKRIERQELSEKWKNTDNIALFDIALEIACLVRQGDESGTIPKEMIRGNISVLASSFGLRVIEKRETNGTWEG